MKPLTALIVDDERLSRVEFRRLLQEFPIIEIAGEAATVAEARDLFERFHPDLVFLDVQLGGESGFEFLAPTTARAHVLLVTAHDERSLPALRELGLPILLKPVNPKRLADALKPYLQTQE